MIIYCIRGLTVVLSNTKRDTSMRKHKQLLTYLNVLHQLDKICLIILDFENDQKGTKIKYKSRGMDKADKDHRGIKSFCFIIGEHFA